MAKRDKKIEVRVSPGELLQIKRYFGNDNISDYVRNHLLEISKDSAIDTTNEQDLYELFKSFLSDDKVARDIFTRFAKETDLGSCDDIINNDNDEPLVWYMGKQVTYSELEKLQKEYEKNNK